MNHGNHFEIRYFDGFDHWDLKKRLVAGTHLQKFFEIHLFGCLNVVLASSMRTVQREGTQEEVSDMQSPSLREELNARV